MRRQVARDLLQTARDGYPRKILVFTSFVGSAARELREASAQAVDGGWKDVQSHITWKGLARAAERGVVLVSRAVERMVKEDERLARSHDAWQLVGALRDTSRLQRAGFVYHLFGHRRFRELLMADLRRRLRALSRVLGTDREGGWWARLHREERRSLRATIAALGRSSVVATYTGHDDRRERDASGEAFRSPLAPWVLVASNVGSEGIDLHTFSAHLVHFDIEWNPARMEQREGRSDRLGRVRTELVNVYFVLVRGTYDERMLHQLVARQRWHSVLLGRSGAQLAHDKTGKVEARSLEAEVARRLTLDLRPSKR